MTLFVVYTPDTGNVVGAVNAIGAVPPADVGALVGEELPLRVSLGEGKVATLVVPARTLAFHTPDDEPLVLTDPLGFGVEQTPDANPKSALVPLQASTEPLSFEDDGLLVKVQTANNIQNTPVLAFVSAGQSTIPLAGAIKAGERELKLAVPVDPGPHGVLVLVSGWAGRLEKVIK